jgi:hypothetical protein
LLEVPVAALRAAGHDVMVDADARGARSTIDADTVIGVGFAGAARIFGVMMDTVWTLRTTAITSTPVTVTYRFGGRRRRGWHGSAAPSLSAAAALNVAAALNAARDLDDLIDRATLKRATVRLGPAHTMIELTPIPGTLTSLYLPPLPPSTVPLRPAEAAAQVALLTRLKDLVRTSQGAANA